MAIATVNPATGQVVKSFEALSSAEIEQKLQKAHEAFATYRQTPFAERAQWMLKAAATLEAEKENYARVMTTEMGKTLRSAVEEAAKCAWVCRYYAENAEKFLADELVETGAKKSYIRYQPLGPVLAVMPWNFPFWQVLRFAAPALMAGNVALLKHASIVPQSALLIDANGVRVALVDTDGVLHYRPIQIGRDYGNDVEVLSGLDTTDVLATGLSANIAEGSRVERAKPATTAPGARTP